MQRPFNKNMSFEIPGRGKAIIEPEYEANEAKAIEKARVQSTENLSAREIYDLLRALAEQQEIKDDLDAKERFDLDSVQIALNDLSKHQLEDPDREIAVFFDISVPESQEAPVVRKRVPLPGHPGFNALIDSYGFICGLSRDPLPVI